MEHLHRERGDVSRRDAPSLQGHDGIAKVLEENVPRAQSRLTLLCPSHKLKDSLHLQVSTLMADSIHVKLPDGSVKDVPKGTTALDIAKSISPRLAEAAIVAKTNGDLIDLTKPLEKDTDLRLLTEKDPESLEVYRHSSPHLLAAPRLEL